MKSSPKPPSASGGLADRHPISALFISPESTLCSEVRSAFERFQIRFSRFDWVSDPRTAQEQISLFEYQLVLVDGSSLETLHDFLCAAGATDRPTPPIVFITRGGSPPELGSAPLGILDTFALGSLTADTALRIARVAAAHGTWSRLIEHHRAFEGLIASISTRFIQLSSSEMDKAIVDALGRCGAFCRIWIT